ncbi:MAG TPA: histidine phosphatase family protein [Burkholderiales bacterium]|nr:histidine phosphatase family protein [Burkholderiales bacterium]
MTRLALLRHADTAWSVEGRIQGRSDLPILPESKIQLAEDLSGMQVVTSPLLRCVQTARLIGAPRAEREPRIAEMRWGEWEGRRLEELRAELGEAMRENEARGWDFRPPGGESPREVLSRVRPWLAELAARATPTLAITHRGVIRALLAEALGWDLRGKAPVKLDWRAAHLFELAPDGRPRAARLNVR